MNGKPTKKTFGKPTEKPNTPQRKKSSQQGEQRAKQDEVQQIRDSLVHFARTWWGNEWISSILDYGRPYRMQRGLQYAQEDRITNLTVTPGQIFAMVEGKMSPTPYRVKINFDIIPEEGWQKIIQKISEKVLYLIKLMENRMPEDLVDIFDASGYPLFPTATRELKADCSCPDQAVPCKHIAATILYIARVVDFDPFLLLKLRGKSKEELLAALQDARSCGNCPVVQSTKKIRELVNEAIFQFSIPSLNANEVTSESFLGKSPLQLGFRFTQPSTTIETLDNLGIVPNISNAVSFESALRELYLMVTKSVYSMATKLEPHELGSNEKNGKN